MWEIYPSPTVIPAKRSASRDPGDWTQCHGSRTLSAVKDLLGPASSLRSVRDDGNDESFAEPAPNPPKTPFYRR